jgi:hypothetical protein
LCHHSIGIGMNQVQRSSSWATGIDFATLHRPHGRRFWVAMTKSGVIVL